MSGWHLRLWRRAKLLPGMRLNLSKSGLSLTLGGKYAKVTYGQRGSTETVSLPGTGLRLTKHEPPTEPSSVPAEQPFVASLLADRLAELTAAHDAGQLTDEEYGAKRAEIIARF